MVCIDLTRFGVFDLVWVLVVEVDVVIENFCLGVMFGFGVGWDDFWVVNLRLVMLLILGFGFF